MTLPTVTKTWNYDVNQVYPAAASVLENYRTLWYNLKQDLINPLMGNWTVVASSNGVTANATDNWTSTSSLTWAANGTAHSWIILQHPANGSQLLIDCNSASAFQISITVSRSGWNISSLSQLNAPSTLNVSGDSISLLSAATVAWGNSNQQFVLHFTSSSDGYCHRAIVYCQDFPVFGLFLETPEDPVPGWNTGLPSFSMIFNSGALSSAIGTTAYTSASVRTRMRTGASATNVTAWLSGESYAGTLLTNGLLTPNEVTNEYPMVDTGIISDTVPCRGKVGKPFDLWYGVANLLTGITYPQDNSRQFAQHGSLIIPWNGSVVVTR